MGFMNIFENDAFSLTSMSEAISRVPTNPATLGQLNLFNDRFIREEKFGIEEREGKLSLIQTSNRGAPLKNQNVDKRKIRYFGTTRIAKSDQIMASELQFVRQFGTNDQIKSLQLELAQRMSGPTGLLADVEYTKEHMRLGAIQGKFVDADGTILYDYFDEFGIIQSTEIAFDLTNTTVNGSLRELIQTKIHRPMRKIAKGARYSGITALCSASFFDALIKNAEVRDTYKGIPEQTWLRTSYDGQSFEFGGVTWKEYVGDDADEDIALTADKCVFIPTGVGNSVFEAIYSPGESFAEVGQMGKSVYAYVNPDKDKDRFVDLEVASYPLFMCKRPDLLFRGKLQA